MSKTRRRGTNFHPLEVQALLKACLTYNVEAFRQAGKSTGDLFYDVQQEMAKHGDFPERPLIFLRAYYCKVQRRYKQGRRPYPPEARELWGRLEGETDVSENDAAWAALTQKKIEKISTCTYLTKLELAEVFAGALRKNVENLPYAKQKEAFVAILNSLHSKKLYLGRNADDLQRAYLKLKNRFLKGKYDHEFPESAAKLWSRSKGVVPEQVDDFPDMDSPEPQTNDSPEPQDREAIKIKEIVCSICLGYASEVKHLFLDVYQNQTYAEIINQTLNVKMLWNGHSSALICQLCATYVEGLPVFWNKCRESCDKLNVVIKAETSSEAGSPLNDSDLANSFEFLVNDSLDEMAVEEVSTAQTPETTVDVILEEILPDEGNNSQVEAESLANNITEEEQNVLENKQNRVSYWKRKPKQCELCGKTVLDLKSHINSHYNYRPEACDLCPKKFTNRNQLLIHRNIHTRERKYPCSYCDAVYASWIGKNVHEKKHIVEMNNISYNCNECDATFTVEKNLRNHIKFKHLNIRQLQCKECEFSTITKIRLLNHVRSIHSKERPYQCPYCNFTSNSNTGYFLHFKRHKNSGEAQEYHIKCCYCEETFPKDAVFERHILQEHPERAIKV